MSFNLDLTPLSPQSTTAIVGGASEGETFYAVFNTPENSIAGSAVCSFSLSDVTRVFQESPFKNQVRKLRARPHSTHSHYWLRELKVQNSPNHDQNIPLM